MASFTSSSSSHSARGSRAAAHKEALADQIFEELAQELQRNKAAAPFTAKRDKDDDIEMMDSDYSDVVESDQTTSPNPASPMLTAFYPDTMDWESLEYPATMEIDEDSLIKSIPTGPRHPKAKGGARKSNNHNNHHDERRNGSTASNPRGRPNQKQSGNPQKGPAGFLGNHKVTKNTNAIKPSQGPRGPKANKANKLRKPSSK